MVLIGAPLRTGGGLVAALECGDKHGAEVDQESHGAPETS